MSLAIPQVCKMPDLSGLDDRQSLNLILERLFRGGGVRDPKSMALVSNFVRLVDQTVRAYRDARADFLEFIQANKRNTGDAKKTETPKASEGKKEPPKREGDPKTVYLSASLKGPTVGALFRAIGDMEHCLLCLRRALRFAESIRRDMHGPKIERHLEILSTGAVERIAGLRDAVEHLEERES